MKRGFIVLIIALFVLGFSSFEQYFIQSTFSEFKNKTSNLYDTISIEQDFATTKNKETLLELENFWKEKEKTLYFFANPFHLEQINLQLYKLKVNIEFENKEESLISLLAIINNIEDFLKASKINWQSII